MRTKLKDDTKNAILKAYENNESTKVIADRFGITRSAVLYWVRKSDLKMRAKSCGWKKYHFDYNYLDKIDTEDKAYFLGFLYADGNLYKPYRKISMELHERDIHILEKFKENLKSTYPLVFWKRKLKVSGNINTYVTLAIIDKHFSEVCEKLGIIPRKSLFIKFPNRDIIPENLVRHFVRGYFDGDGSISWSADGGRTPYVSIIATDEFSKSIQQEFYKITGINGLVAPTNETRGMSFFRLSGRIKGLLFLKWIYDGATIYLNRKYDKYKEFLDWYPKELEKNNRKDEQTKKIDLERILHLDFNELLKQDNFSSKNSGLCCEQLVRNIKLMNNLSTSNKINGGDGYLGDLFKFCPFCGKDLTFKVGADIILKEINN